MIGPYFLIPRALRKHTGSVIDDVQVEWDELEHLFRRTVEARFAHWIGADQPHYGHNLEFGVNRFSEGRQLVDFFLPKFDERPIRVIDVGSGNGGASLALSNHPGFEVTAVDYVPNSDLLAVRHEARLPLAYLTCDARELPFVSGHFDVALSLETIEHVEQPGKMGAEIMRVLRPGGMCMVTTAARIPHLLRPDPHFSIRGLLLLPDALQETCVRRVRPEVVEYDVAHMFWSVGGIARCFPGRTSVQTLVNIPYPGRPRTISQWAKYISRRFCWDRIIVRK